MVCKSALPGIYINCYKDDFVGKHIRFARGIQTASENGIILTKGKIISVYSIHVRIYYRFQHCWLFYWYVFFLMKPCRWGLIPPYCIHRNESDLRLLNVVNGCIKV